MRKETTVILGMILLLSSISAIDLCKSEDIWYAGDKCIIELSEPYEYYSIVGNVTEIDLTLNESGNNVTVSVGKYNNNDTFELIFFNIEKEVITQYVSGGGGGGSTTKYVDRNITEYIDRNITEYINKPAEIVYEEVEVVKEKVPNILYGLLLFCFIVIISFMVYLMKRDKEWEHHKNYLKL